MAVAAFSTLIPSVLRIIDSTSSGVHAVDVQLPLPWRPPFANEQDVEHLLDAIDRLLLLLSIAGYGVPQIVLDAGAVGQADLLSVSLPDLGVKQGTSASWTPGKSPRMGLRVCPTTSVPLDLSTALAAQAPEFSPGVCGWLFLNFSLSDPVTSLTSLVATLWTALVPTVAGAVSPFVDAASSHALVRTAPGAASLGEFVAYARRSIESVGASQVLQAEYQAQDGGPDLADQMSEASTSQFASLITRSVLATTAESLWDYWIAPTFGGGSSGRAGASAATPEATDRPALGPLLQLGALRAILCWVGTTEVIDAQRNDVFTIIFCGTACTRDEGEATRPESDMRIYRPGTGYIPVRIHLEISGQLDAKAPSVTVRGVGENDWAAPRDDSEPLLLDGPLKVPQDLIESLRQYSGGNQRSDYKVATGRTLTALALHGANLAAASGARQFNFLGHSRGAVECVMAAWLLYAYGLREPLINIFAIDPVPGPGDWYGTLTQLSPNVANYVGVYAWDHFETFSDRFFLPLVPRPNGPMSGQPGEVPLGASWDTLADKCQRADPLAPGDAPQPSNYKLYACRGRHSTVAGNTTADGYYDPSNLSDSVAPVPELIYRLARAYLTQWGTTFAVDSAVQTPVAELRRSIHTDHARFDAMCGGETRTSLSPLRPYVRRVSSISGRNPVNTYYLEDVVGDPPYTLAYPATIERTGKGWVNWDFL